MVFTHGPSGIKQVNNYMQKRVKYPEITTTWPCNDRADTQTTLRKIQDKLREYGMISPKEQAYLDRFGKIRQKKAFS